MKVREVTMLGRRAVSVLLLTVAPAACQGTSRPIPEAAAGLRHVAEIELPGPPVRFDYQNGDTAAGGVQAVGHVGHGREGSAGRRRGTITLGRPAATQCFPRDGGNAGADRQRIAAASGAP